MRLTKCEEHKLRTKKYVRKFALFPKTVQNIRIWLESYYEEYLWTSIPDVHNDMLLYYGCFIKTRIGGWCYSKLENMKVSQQFAEWKLNDTLLPEDKRVQEYLLTQTSLHKVMREDDV